MEKVAGWQKFSHTNLLSISQLQTDAKVDMLVRRTWHFACRRSFSCPSRLWYSKTHQGRFFSHVVWVMWPTVAKGLLHRLANWRFHSYTHSCFPFHQKGGEWRFVWPPFQTNISPHVMVSIIILATWFPDCHHKHAFSDVATLYNSAVCAGSYMKINHETGYPSWIILRLSAEQLPTRRIASLCNVSRR